MQENLATFVGSLMSFLPAFILMTHLLNRYESRLDDRKMYKGFFGGIVLALVVYLFMLIGFIGFVIEDGDEEEIARGVSKAFWSIPALAFMISALMAWFMNRKGFRGKEETSFYGAAMGFGFSSMFAFIMVSRPMVRGELDSDYEILLLIPLALGIVLIQGSIGSVMGYGCVHGMLIKSFFYGGLLHVLMNICFFMRALGYIPQELLAALALFYGSLLYMYVYARLLPRGLTRGERMKLQRGQGIGPRRLGLAFQRKTGKSGTTKNKEKKAAKGRE